jgi:hypothetical protein
MSLQPVYRYPASFAVQDSVSLFDVKFGAYAVAWNEKYGAEMLLRWRFNAAAGSGPTGFRLDFGVRQGGNIVFSMDVLDIDYLHLGVTDVESELTDIGIFPECGISVTPKGITVIYALYPSQAQTYSELTSAPMFDIDCLVFGNDSWYQNFNSDWQKVEDGKYHARGCRWLSCPAVVEDGRQPMQVRWFCTAMDTLDADDEHFYMFTRN